MTDKEEGPSFRESTQAELETVKAQGRLFEVEVGHIEKAKKEWETELEPNTGGFAGFQIRAAALEAATKVANAKHFEDVISTAKEFEDYLRGLRNG